ncbi:type II toxin-antitoxin system PemK/MazF family toxin [Actinokineospora sp. 24-640]
MTRLTPWQVWWADFNPQVGREQAGMRPAIIVGTALACRLPNRLALVVPCTTTNRGLPFHPRITLNDRPGYAMCDQVKSISTDRLVKPHPAHLTPTEIDTIRFALRQMIDVR